MWEAGVVREHKWGVTYYYPTATKGRYVTGTAVTRGPTCKTYAEALSAANREAERRNREEAGR